MEIIGRENLAKWKLEKAKDENKKLPYGVKISKHRLFNDLYDLEPTEKVIYIGLCLFKDQQGYCYPSMRKLANDLNISKNTIQKNIWGLKEKGFIKIDTKRGKKGKRYGYWLLK
jgi:biotin operon repressor